ncbi:peroxide stress protein YaaA [Clostridium sp. LY3-2]|uniref:peroxide stress protein YaaA n=1 Tax=Clostridium sp. LY3-2 TaxID=2942482 RepID=UPI002152324D|nr:peroxide stress protein YaaA [Clostridium sp. LY3-2]MCR6515482.1 peroxide stress protein YaaA [Clostridium sp. LY3-2]
MLVILSPAKKMELKSIDKNIESSYPLFIKEAKKLNDELKKLNPDELAKYMKISDSIVNEVFKHIHNFDGDENTFSAAFGYNGEAFRGLNIESYNKEDLEYANSHLRILSGLYGVLRPLDKIKEYRLEMGLKYNFLEDESLYKYWGDKINKCLLFDIKKTESDILVNLASKEYSKSAKLGNLKNIKVVEPVFKEFKNGKYKVVTVHAKRARGLMTTYIIKNRIKDIESLKKFDLEGYVYREDLSSSKELVFTLN